MLTITDAQAALRQRVLEACLTFLAADGPQLARELRERLAATGLDVDKHFINTTLYRLGRDRIEHDPRTGEYRLMARGRHEH